MKIYFAGSIRGGREKRQDYFEIINYCKGFGEILTEHIGSDDIKNIGEQKSNESIYLRDIGWINDADFIIADVTIASLGVGYEIAFAEKLSKKILCIYDKNINSNISAMISGNSSFNCQSYNSLDEAKEIIKCYITKNFNGNEERKCD